MLTGDVWLVKAWALGIALLLLAGCAQPDGPAAGEGAPEAAGDGSPSPTLAPGDGSGPAPPPNGTAPGGQPGAPGPGSGPSAPAPPRIRDAGLAWSDCTYRVHNFFHAHEWADPLVPTEYRQTSTPPDLGQSVLFTMACAAYSIGNATFIAGGSLSYFGVGVQAPDAVQGPAGNAYVLDWLSDREALVQQLAETGNRAEAAGFAYAADDLDVRGDTFGIAVHDSSHIESGEDETALLRLHWKVDGRWCYLDVEQVLDPEETTSPVTAEGLAGDAAALGGPAQRMGGLGERGLVSGHLGPMACVEATA